ncbi:ribonuclease III [Mycoplasmopsis meleagridis]|uniref:ribonuclease III n=1 Tax=Mycoplasmopsis meleagridis TaxID=29561 RepID=UPI003A85A9C5
MSNSGFDLFMQQFDIKIKSYSLYREALTHPSYTKFSSKKNDEKNYQNLEFLGDSLLQFLVSTFLFEKQLADDQGKLTLLRSKMVNTKNLNEISNRLNLKFFLLTAPGKMGEEVKRSEKVGADIYESFVAAIYLDQGLEIASKFVSKTLFPTVKHFLESDLKDFKTIFQEKIQSYSKNNVIYSTYHNNGIFESKVIHDNQIYGIGQGKNKLEAEENAAKNALEKLKIKIG